MPFVLKKSVTWPPLFFVLFCLNQISFTLPFAFHSFLLLSNIAPHFHSNSVRAQHKKTSILFDSVKFTSSVLHPHHPPLFFSFLRFIHTFDVISRKEAAKSENLICIYLYIYIFLLFASKHAPQNPFPSSFLVSRKKIAEQCWSQKHFMVTLNQLKMYC